MAKAATLAVDITVTRAIKALAAGNASDSQQKRALDWIIETAAGLKLDPFNENPNVTSYMVGRQSVARQIVSVIEAAMPRHQEKAANG